LSGLSDCDLLTCQYAQASTSLAVEQGKQSVFGVFAFTAVGILFAQGMASLPEDPFQGAVRPLGQAANDVADAGDGIISNMGRITKGAALGYTKHGLNSAISHNDVGVSPAAILDALKVGVPPTLRADVRGATLAYKGSLATVIVNQQTRLIVTAWAITRNGRRLQ
jgi:hypothetical protein